MKTVTVIAAVLLIVGGLNWGLVGAFDFNLVDSLFGEKTVVSRFVYVVVGLAALWQLVALFTDKSASKAE